MATNYVQPGKVLTLTAPTGGCESGTPYLFGSIFGVATSDAAEAAAVEVAVEGVWDLPKVGSQQWTEGQKIYWNDAAADSNGQVCSNVATVGQLIGVAVKPLPGSGAGETTGRVRLNGVAPATAEGPQATIAALTMGTAITAATANGALVDSSATNPSDAQFNENMKELAVKINAIIAALEAAGLLTPAG